VLLSKIIACLTIPDCWSQRENVHGFGGRPLHHNINSVPACQSACLSDPSCVAIDYDHMNPYRQYCWLLTSIHWTARARGVTHYVLNREHCSSKLDI